MPLDDDLLGSLRDVVRDQRDQAVQFLCDLVKEGSLLGQEQGAQDIMAERFGGMGLAVERFDVDLDQIRNLPGFSPPVIDNYSGRENVVGIHRPKGPAAGRSLILNGHIDVVPTGDVNLWTNHPFDPAIRDGKVFGRGSADMKAGIVAYCMAFEALQSLGLQPASEVIMQSVVEEECTGNGALACLARGYRADAAVIPEPFHQQLMTAQLGVMWLSVHLTGKPAHVLDTSAGVNAIEAAFAIFDNLREVETEWNLPENRHELYCDHDHPVNFNLGKVTGGDWASTVPCSASVDVRVGFYPGMSLEDVRKTLEDKIAEAVEKDSRLKGVNARVEYRGFQAEGCVVDQEGPLMTSLAVAHRRITNAPIEMHASTATTDCRFFELYGDTPATCYGPQGSDYHGIDEWVSIGSMMEVILVLAVFMAEWCGVEDRV